MEWKGRQPIWCGRGTSQQRSVMDSQRMDDIAVRAPVNADEEAIAEVHALAIADLRKVYRPNEKAFDNLSRISSSLTPLVATKGERVVGTVQLRVEDDRYFVTALSVHPAHRRQGVARALVDAIAKIAGSAGSRCVALHTVKETGNVAVFDRLGFQTVEESEEDFFESDLYDVLTNVYMERPLCAEC